MALTAEQVINSALSQIAAQTRIVAFAENSPAANAARVVYAPTVQLMLREIQPDFARFTGPLTLSGAVTPVPPWAFEYLYPDACLRLRQVRPPRTGPYAADPFDPKPVLANVAFDIIGVLQTRVILTNQASALAVYTTSAVTEAAWDAAFTDAVIRRLANPLAMALSGRPDFAKTILEQSAQMAQTAEAIDEGTFRRG